LVPEAGSLALLGPGLGRMGLGFSRRRGRAAVVRPLGKRAVRGTGHRAINDPPVTEVAS